jgi:hypothetical protein
MVEELQDFEFPLDPLNICVGDDLDFLKDFNCSLLWL